MAFTIEFDDHRLTERIRDPYKGIDEAFPLGMSFADFISLGENLQNSDHIYFKLVDDMDGRINQDSFLYVRLKEFVDLCIKDPALYTMENFMFFLHIVGLSVPQHHLQYHFESDKAVEDRINPYFKISSLEKAIRGFDKSDKSEHAITSVYTCEGIEDICMASLYHFIKLGLVVKRCANCGKYFVPLRRSDTIYCDRSSPYNPSRTCKEDGSHRTFEGKLKADGAEKLRRSIYQAKKMRIRRNPDNKSYQEDFEKWKADVARWRGEIKKGLKTSEEFMVWLKESKK